MNKITTIISVFLIALLGASFIFAADHETSPLHFSDQLNDGDRFEWKVRFYENDTVVTTFDPELGFVNDSVVELEIYSNVHSIDVNGAPTETDLNSAFALRIDGVNQPLLEVGEINQWLLLFLNPTDLFLPGFTDKTNYYHYLVDNGESHFLLNDSGVIDTTNDSYRVSEERISTLLEDNENRKVWEEAEYELGRGALRYFSHYEEFYDETNVLIGNIDVEFFLVSSSDGGMDFEFFHFSDLLNTGDVFTWDVLKLSGTGELSTIAGAPGAQMQIEILSEPEFFDFNDSTADPDTVFKLTFDGILADINTVFEFESFINIIFPVFVDYENGTTINNFFEELRNNPDLVDLDPDETISFTADTITHTATRTEDGYSKSENVTWDIQTGVMIHAYFSEWDTTGALTSEVELERIHDDGMDFDFFHFSDLLNTGDTFTWDVIKLAGTGEIVTIAGGVGSQMQIEILSEPELFDLKDETADPDDVFKLTFDGVLADINTVFEFESFINIIFPVFVDYENGTTINNFFEHLRDNPDTIDLEPGETVTFTADTATHKVTRDEEGFTRTEEVTWDLQTGVMIHAYFSETDVAGVLISEVEFQRTTTTNPIDTSSGTDTEDTTAPLPGMTYLWVFSALIAIPIIRKKNN